MLQSRLRHDVHALSVFRLLRTIQNSWLGLDLAAHFTHHRTSCAANGIHAVGGEQEGKQAPNEHPDDHSGVHQAKLDLVTDEHLQVLDVRAKQHHRREPGRRDGVPLGHRLHRVAHGIQFVRDLPNLFWQTGHDRNATRVVRDRTEGIQRNHNARKAQHRHDRNRDSVQIRPFIAAPNRSGDGQHRQQCRMVPHADARNDVRRMARLRGLGNPTDGIVMGRCVVVRDPDDQNGHDQADQRTIKDVG